MIRAIFFDVGGTLRVLKDPQSRDDSKLNRLKEVLGLELSIDDLVTRIRKGEKEYRRWCKPNFIELDEKGLWTRFLMPDQPQEFIAENAVKLNQLWRESRPKQVLPDMVDTLQTLHARGYQLGLISNTTSSVEAHQLLQETGLTSIVPVVILSAAYGKRKPDPSLFITAARQAGVDPRECAYVGDRPSRDLIGSRQANFSECTIINVFSSSVDTNDPDDYDPEKDAGLLIRPDHFIGRLTQLLDYYPGVPSSTVTASPEVKPVVLYDAALSSMWGVDQKLMINQTFEQARSIGISRFELNHKFTPELFAQFDKDHYYVSTLHDPCPAPISLEQLKRQDLLISSPDEALRKAAVDGVKRTIDLANKLGSRSVVIHPGSVQADAGRDRQLREMFNKGLSGTAEYAVLREEMISHRARHAQVHVEQVRKSLEEIIDHTRGSKVALGLENRYRYYDIPLPDELQSFLDLCEEDWFGFQFDCGHAQALDRLGIVPMLDWLERFGKRMVGCHLHDVKGLTDHLAPGLGEIDFAAIAPYIPENACRTLEIGPEATLEQIAAGLEILTGTGCIVKL